MKISRKKWRRRLWPALAAAFVSTAATAQTCDILDADTFGPGSSQPERIHLVAPEQSPDQGRFIVFRAKLRVNTDGAANSYHPIDLTGQQQAINHICNGVSVRDSQGRRLSCNDSLPIIRRFRDSNWTPPAGYTIRWQNVIAARTEQGRSIPCVFRSGPNQGYFGSLTTLKNGLAEGQRGECDSQDQIDQRFIPTLVLPGGDNPLRRFGARLGDLVVTHNPANGVTQAAIIADSGPPDNIGEGSVALNMALLRRTDQPRNYRPEALRLDTGSQQILVAVIPRSATFQRVRPYTAQNIADRAGRWAAAQGYQNVEAVVDAMKRCGPN